MLNCLRRPVPVRDWIRPDCAYIYQGLKRDGVPLGLQCDGSA